MARAGPFGPGWLECGLRSLLWEIQERNTTPPKPLLLGPPLLPGDGSVLINCFLPRLLPPAARGTFLPAPLLLPAWITGSELAGSAPLTAQACGQ